MSATPTNRTDWYWTDWLGAQDVRRLTPAERGVWIDMVGLASFGTPYGYVTDAKGNPIDPAEIARLSRVKPASHIHRIINSLVDKGVASRDEHGRTYCRRMVLRAQKHEKKKVAGKAGGDATALKNNNMQADLLQHMPQQPRKTSFLSLKEEEKDSVSESLAPREAQQQQETEPQSAPATALPVGARALAPEQAAKRATDWKPGEPFPVSQSLIDHEILTRGYGRAAE